jgi:hypothetical protein
MQPIGQLERALPPASRRAASVSAQAVSCSGVTVGAGVGGLAVDQALRHPWPVFGSFRTFGAAQDRRHDIALKDQASFGFAPRSRHGSASGEAVALKFSCISIGWQLQQLLTLHQKCGRTGFRPVNLAGRHPGSGIESTGVMPINSTNKQGRSHHQKIYPKFSMALPSCPSVSKPNSWKITCEECIF